MFFRTRAQGSVFPRIGIGVLLLAVLVPGVVGARLRYQEGTARDPASNALLYRERHWLRDDGDRPIERLVVYLCPDGRAFGRKQVDYRRSASAPAFRLVDARSGYAEGLREAAGARVFFQPAGGSEKSVLLASKRLVVDAGFDEFIREQWPALTGGTAVPLDFALPARLQSMGFSVRRVGQTQLAGEPAWVFRLRLSGLLGWVAPHIDVAYGQNSRRLLRFEGVSNVRDDRGRKEIIARIDFQLPARVVEDGQWQAAMRTPLVACSIGQ
jgi:hypothetical protein